MTSAGEASRLIVTVTRPASTTQIAASAGPDGVQNRGNKTRRRRGGSHKLPPSIKQARANIRPARHVGDAAARAKRLG
jgi:hypothetical protein